MELDTGALVAGAKLRGELEERVKRLVESISPDDDHHDAVLVVENFDALLGRGPWAQELAICSNLCLRKATSLSGHDHA